MNINAIIENLNKNNMNGIFAETKAEVCAIVKDILFEGATISSGGSMSLKESGVYDIITSSDYNYLDRMKPGITEEEKQNVFKNIIGCDFYFCSSNALTEAGELVNVDGFANRISAIAFGPKKVIMIVGINKIVKDVNEGILRVKKIAAPKNAVRLHTETPCEKLGHCISFENSNCPDITDGCNCEKRICCDYLISAKQREKGRITVIICSEDLGY